MMLMFIIMLFTVFMMLIIFKGLHFIRLFLLFWYLYAFQYIYCEVKSQLLVEVGFKNSVVS